MSKPKLPTDEQIDVAIDWLLINEGEEGEKEACHEVARFLGEYILDQTIKKEARKHKVPVAALRKTVEIEKTRLAKQEDV